MEQENIVEKVHQALERGMDTRGLDINISYSSGVLTLQGVVDWLEEKNKAECIAQEVVGAHKVENAITLAVEGHVSDQEITAGVLDKLQEQQLEQFGAETHDGTVSLLGHATEKEEQKALELASQVRGVKEVYSQVKHEN
ncbi:osmotically-inducible protein OsmY [Desulfitispora alkaliphila]|uniref:BON domain-containing protein n=1 Tax=Desulfitispora alkaliphila TaxID=622674 RepID=UPI003D261B2C